MYREEYTTTELRAAYRLTDRWFISAYIPFVQKTRWIDQQQTGTSSALGDPSVMIQFSPVLSKSQENKQLKHRLTTGAGVKIPLGQTQAKWKGDYLDHDLQPGSGSYDLLFSFEYQARLKGFGVQLFSFATLTTANLSSYRYGENLSLTSVLYYQHTFGKLKLAPTFGLSKEYIQRDVYGDQRLDNSGGDYLFSSFGMDIRYKNVSIQGNYNSPISQEFNGVQLPVEEKFQIGITYSIESKRKQK